jgi:hypothetical protein
VQWDALDPCGAFHSRGDKSRDGNQRNEGEDTGRMAEGRSASSLKGFRGDVENLACSTGKMTCTCVVTRDVIPMDVEEHNLKKVFEIRGQSRTVRS